MRGAATAAAPPAQVYSNQDEGQEAKEPREDEVDIIIIIIVIQAPGDMIKYIYLYIGTRVYYIVGKRVKARA